MLALSTDPKQGVVQVTFSSEATKIAFNAFIEKLKQTESMSTTIANLRNKFEGNLTFFFFCLWAARDGYGPMKPAELMKIEKSSALWHACLTKPLKSLESQIKTSLPSKNSLTEQIEQIILASQKIEQNNLTRSFNRKPKQNRTTKHRLNDACKNWFNYFKLKQLTPEGIEEEIYKVLNFAFTEFKPKDIREVCDNNFLNNYNYGHQFTLWPA